ncbi:hypothetical protein A4A49_55511 [Nicotiana attenuata]|uniref:G-patch domain-containing protein n=1 Tax=Nicotiana attenuata TaxID=49451 RepID=A0A1J6JNR6_NICAT|nr:hypothetical protein A4A49_55511 [Nicotiana attenuata]
MGVTEMMKYGYRPGIGLGARSNGITEPIEPNGQKGRAGIGYQPPVGKTHTGSSGKKAFVPEHVLCTGHSSPPEGDIVDGMGRLFMTMIEECYEGTDIKTPTIRNVEPREELRDRTARLSLVCRVSW